MFLFLAFHFTAAVVADVVSLAATRTRKELMIHTTRIIIIIILKPKRNAANKTSRMEHK